MYIKPVSNPHKPRFSRQENMIAKVKRFDEIFFLTPYHNQTYIEVDIMDCSSAWPDTGHPAEPDNQPILLKLKNTS